MGHGSSSQGRKIQKQSGQKIEKCNNLKKPTNWNSQDLGEKVKSLLESNAHRQNAIILPTKSEIIQSLHNSRRPSINPQSVEAPKFIRLSFLGGEEHQKWMKETGNNVIYRSEVQSDKSNDKGLPESSSSEFSVSEWKRNDSKSKPRPQIITNWLKDLKVLISDDENENQIKSNTSPVFIGKFISPDEEPLQDIMLSSNIPRRPEDVGLQSDDNQAQDSSDIDQSRMYLVPETVRIDPNRKAYDEYQQSPHLMVASSRSNPVIYSKDRSKNSQHSIGISDQKFAKQIRHCRPVGTSSSEDVGDSSTCCESLQSSSVHLSSRRVSGSSGRDSSDAGSSEEGCLDHRVVRNYLKPRQSLRSSSYTGFGPKKTSIIKFNEEYQRLDKAEWEHRNFDKTLKHSIGRRRPRNHRHETQWSNHLSNFSFVQSSDQCCQYCRKHAEDQFFIGAPKLSYSPPVPSHRGFDPYIKYERCHFESHNESMHVSDNKGMSFNNHYLSSSQPYRTKFFESQNDLCRRSNNDESGHSRIQSSRLWQKNDMVVNPCKFSASPKILQRSRQPANQKWTNKPSGAADLRPHVHSSEEEYHHNVKQRHSAPSEFQDNATPFPQRLSVRNRHRPISARTPISRSRPSLSRQDATDESANRVVKTRYRHFHRNSNSLGRPGLKRNDSAHSTASLNQPQVDSVLQHKMNLMVKDLLSGTSNSSQSIRRDGKSNDAIGAIHERVAAALASVLMSKTLPTLSNSPSGSK